jgi:hypothetical protein
MTSCCDLAACENTCELDKTTCIATCTKSGCSN